MSYETASPYLLSINTMFGKNKSHSYIETGKWEQNITFYKIKIGIMYHFWHIWDKFGLTSHAHLPMNRYCKVNGPHWSANWIVDFDDENVNK